MNFTIGRHPDNDIQIAKDDKTVSKFHLKAEYDGKSLILKSINSSSFHINQDQKKAARIQKGDSLRVGDHQVDVPNLFKEINKKFFKDKKDFTKEFTELKSVFKTYEKKKSKIGDGSTKKIQFIRISITILVLVALLFLPIPETMKYPLLVGAGILGSIFTALSTSNTKKAEKLDELHAEYENLIICPKPTCKKNLINRTLAYYEKKKSCPFCDAIYIKSN